MMCLYSAEPCYYHDELTVKAVTSLAQHSSTETIDVSKLSQATPQLIQYADIADAGGRLFCVDRQFGADCWLKIVSIANDCQSSNVVLMTTSNGVALRTIRAISPGEPLLMWFAENILAMLNMPYLTNLNIQESRYKCHLCDLTFDYPNPLKIHLALQCDRLDSSFLWTHLAREFAAAPYSLIAINLFQALPAFSFKLSRSPRASPDHLSPIASSERIGVAIAKPSSLEDLHSDSGYGLSSPNSSGLSASSVDSDIEKSPTSLRSLAFSSPSPMATASFQLRTRSPLKEPPAAPSSHHSAFKPYSTKCRLFSSPDSHKSSSPSPATTGYRLHSAFSAASASAVIVRPDAQAAHMETLVSNLGKSTGGHRCLYCGKIYSRKYGLKIHIRTHTGYKPLKCRVCQRPFGDPSNLNKHIRLHVDGELPYK